MFNKKVNFIIDVGRGYDILINLVEWEKFIEFIYRKVERFIKFLWNVIFNF